MASPPPRSIKISIGTLVVAALVAVAALLLNHPSAKDIRFDIVCESAVLPDLVHLNLRQTPTELQSFSAWGFDVSAKHADRILFGPDQQPLKPISADTVQLTAEGREDSPNSWIDVTRTGTIGNLIADVSSGVELSSTGGADRMPSLTLASHRAGDVQLMVASAQISVNRGIRYSIQQPPGFSGGDFHLVLSAPLPLLFQATSGRHSRSSATLHFQPSAADLPLLDKPQTWSSGSLSFTRALNPDLRIDDQKAQGVILDRRADLALAFDHLTLTSIALAAGSPQAGAPQLRLTGTARATSLRQEEHQLLPTVLDEILPEPVSDRTLGIVGLIAIAAVFFKVVDHALDILLDKLIPRE